MIITLEEFTRTVSGSLVCSIKEYTVSTGVISKELNGENIIAKPLMVDEHMRVGIIMQKNMTFSRYGKAYMEAIKKHVIPYV